MHSIFYVARALSGPREGQVLYSGTDLLEPERMSGTDPLEVYAFESTGEGLSVKKANLIPHTAITTIGPRIIEWSELDSMLEIPADTTS